MKNLKREILFTLLFITIGIAVVTTNVAVNMSTPIASNTDDFLVYFSDVKVNGTQDLSLVRNEKQLVFAGEFSAVGDKKVISYDVTNASQNYDANITINCTKSNDYLIINNSFDTDNVLGARSTRTGTLSVELKNAVSEEILQDVTCTIEANAVEKENISNADVSLPVQGPYSVGTEVVIGEEKFNVVESTDETVTLLAQYPLDSNYRQDSSTTIFTNLHDFAEYYDYDIDSSVKELDIQLYDEFFKIYVNEYASYIKTITGDLSLKGDLITLKQLKNLGCTITDDYSDDGNLTCLGSKNYSWLVKEFFWYTKSLSPSSGEVWRVGLNSGDSNGKLYDSSYGWNNGASSIRPLIIISKDYFGKDIISFTIDSNVYYAYEGMYWSEWVNSPFNTAGYFIEEDERNFHVTLNGGGYVVNDSPTVDTILKNGYEYVSYEAGWKA